MKYRFSKYKRKFKFIYILFFLFIFFLIYTSIEKNIKPTMIAMSEIKARQIATQVISDAVNQKIMNNTFSNLVDVKLDSTGKVTMVQANTVEMNKLAVATSIAIQDEIRGIGVNNLKIPISNILGSQVFSNIGPTIKINILPAGSVDVDFNTEFQEAGINQTRLTIYLIVKTQVQIVVPLASEKIEVSSHIPVSETIIVGEVPESYINVPKDNNDYMNFIPTKDPLN